MIKRAGIFVFYDAEGVVDGYVEYFLQELRTVVDYLVIVANKHLNPKGRDIFADLSDDFFVRENNGYDVWATYDALEYIGWDKLKDYDELVVSNDTFYGPFIPFEIIFERMEEKSCDFWSLQRRYRDDNMTHFLDKPLKLGYMPEYPISHFRVYRSNILHSYEFKYFWDNIPLINHYADASLVIEADFTTRMCDAGFTFDTYDGEKQRNFCPSPTVQATYQQIAQLGVPIIRRRAFTHTIDTYVSYVNGNDAAKALDWIDKHTDYDVDLIWENLLRRENQFDLKNRLCLNRILSADIYEPDNGRNMKIAVTLHIYYIDLIEKAIDYINRFPKGTHIRITTDTDEKIEIIKQQTKKIIEMEFSYRVVTNRGRDVSSRLIGARDLVLSGEYDLVCALHVKKSVHQKWNCIGASFFDTCYENTAVSTEYIQNVMKLFSENPRLGIASPPPPNVNTYYRAIGGNWGRDENYTKTVELMKKLNLNVHLDIHKPPVAPLGSMFWFRCEALKPLFQYEWKYEDFPLEPLPDVDGTIIHAIERAHSLIAQAKGYYPVVISNTNYAQMELTRMTYETQQFIEILSIHKEFRHSQSTVVMRTKLKKHVLKIVEKANTPIVKKANTPIVKKQNIHSLTAGGRLKHGIKKCTPPILWELCRKWRWKTHR